MHSVVKDFMQFWCESHPEGLRVTHFMLLLMEWAPLIAVM